MSVGEAHFLGFDPTRGFEQIKGCPAYDPAAVIVWFEQWFFTGWWHGLISDTGIYYNHCYAAFDSLGNVISTDPRWGFKCCGMAGNETCSLRTRCPRPDEWLDRARAACASAGLPAPGTIELNPRFRRDYGTKSPPELPAR